MTQTAPPAPARPEPPATRSPRSPLLTVLLPIVITLLVVAGFAVVVAPLIARPPVNLNYAVAGASEVQVTAPDSPLDLGPSTDGRVHVHVTGWSLVRPDIRVRTQAGRTTVQARCAPFAWFGACALRLAVAVPPASAVTVNGSNGTITAAGMTGAFTAGTANGAVLTDDMQGPLVLRSTNGRIEATRCGSASVHAGTTNGPVALTFRSAPSDVVATSTNGSVTVTVPSAVAYAVTSGTANGSVDTSSIRTDPASDHRIEARTTNGSVRIIPGD